MILTVDIGNSYIIFGVHDNGDMLFSSRIKTDPLKTETELAVLISNLIRLNGCEASGIAGAAVSSVVPAITSTACKAISELCGIEPMVVGPGIKTGLNIKIDNPSSLAADMCCAAVGAMEKYPLPAIIIDLGTATKITVVDKDRSYIGGAIAPGVMVSLGALAKKTALLPSIGLDRDIKVIGTETSEAMLSGIVLGTASMLDGMIERFIEQIGEVKTVVACGGLASSVIPHCRREGIIIDRDLSLHGLLAIYNKNAR